jgi:isopenicillin N synthase-like dioxygenase
LQEKWEMNNFDSPADARERGVPEQYLDRFSTNLWPTQLPHFVDAVTACFAAGRALGDRVMGLFAVALGLDEDFFAAGCVNDSSYFAVNNYPGLSTEPSGDVALFEHSDSGTLTLLHQRGNYEGLQVGLRSGERFSVPVIDDAVIVNIGDLMARWTNDRWLATRHRVLLGETGQHRTSITTFHTPSLDTIVSPLPTCIDAGTPYEPISVYDWEPVFLAKTYQ